MVICTQPAPTCEKINVLPDVESSAGPPYEIPQPTVREVQKAPLDLQNRDDAQDQKTSQQGG